MLSTVQTFLHEANQNGLLNSDFFDKNIHSNRTEKSWYFKIGFDSVFDDFLPRVHFWLKTSFLSILSTWNEFNLKILV